jgi:hypothetical protein
MSRGPAQLVGRVAEAQVLPLEQCFGRHHLVRLEIRVPPIRGRLRVLPRGVADALPRPQPDCPTVTPVYERGRNLSVVQQSQRASPEPAARGNRDAIRETAVRFYHHGQELVATWQIHVEQSTRLKSDPCAEDLAWTQARMHRTKTFQAFL